MRKIKLNTAFFCLLIFFFFLIPTFWPKVFVYSQISDWNNCLTSEGVPTLKCFEVIFSNLLFMSSAVVVLILFIMFIIGSFRYLTSGGNPEAIKKAQGTLKWALIGFLIFLASYLILRTIDCLFLGCQGTLLKFEIPEFTSP